MMSEQLEYLISLQSAGVLTAAEQAMLARQLQDSPQARGLAADYAALDAFLASAPPLPAVDWNGLSDRIAMTVTEQGIPRRIVAGRAWWAVSTAAMAASVLVAIGLTLHAERGRVTAPPSPAAPAVAVAEVDGPHAQTAVQAVADVSVGPPAPGPAAQRYPDAEGVVLQPSHVEIASAVMIAPPDAAQ